MFSIDANTRKTAEGEIRVMRDQDTVSFIPLF